LKWNLKMILNIRTDYEYRPKSQNSGSNMAKQILKNNVIE